jgi:hypothetical protein
MHFPLKGVSSIQEQTTSINSIKFWNSQKLKSGKHAAKARLVYGEARIPDIAA